MPIPRKALATAASGGNEGNSGDRRILVVSEHTSSMIVEAFHRYLQNMPMIDRMKRFEEGTDEDKKYKVEFCASTAKVEELVWTLHKNALPDDDLAKPENRHATAQDFHSGLVFSKDGTSKTRGVYIRPLEGDAYLAGLEILNNDPARARKLYGPLLQSEAFIIKPGPHPNENYTSKFQISPDGFEVERMTIVQRPDAKLSGATIVQPAFGPGSGRSA